jgi:hypothetical protein
MNLLDRLPILKRFHRRRHADYTRTFEPPQGQRVLADLRGFCTSRLADPNPFEMARFVGRQEAWLHIQSVLGYSEEQIAELIQLERDQRNQEAMSA